MIYKTKILILIFFNCLCLNIYSQNATEIFNKSVNSVVLITDYETGLLGSGFFINKNTIITNWHVINSITESSTLIENIKGQKFNLGDISEFYELDLSILKTIDNSSYYLPLASNISQGEKIYAIGNPTSSDNKVYDFSITSGIVNNILEEDWYYENERQIHSALVILHQASTNPGNSGGPLLNSNGEVVGVNTFFLDRANNMNFSVHVNELKKILNDNNISYKVGKITLEENTQTIDDVPDSINNSNDTNIVSKSPNNIDSETKEKEIQKKSEEVNYSLIGIIVFIVVLILIVIILQIKKKKKIISEYSPEEESSESIDNKAYLNYKNKRYNLNRNGLTIGRSKSNDVILDNKSVSRKHAMIVYVDSNYSIKDLESKNGTYVNGEKINKAILNNEDEISLGNSKLIFFEQ